MLKISGETVQDQSLDHLFEKTVDKFFPVTKVATFREVVGLFAPSATSVVQLEVPEEIVGHFEVGSDSENLVDEILDANDTEFAQSLFDDFVGEGASATLQFAESALVNEFPNGFEVGITPSDVRIGDSQHAQRRFVQLNKSSVVDLTETQQLQNLSDSGVETVDTPDPHNDGQFGLGGNVKVAMFTSVARQAHLVGFRFTVLLDVLFGTLEDGRALSLGLFLLEKRGFDLFRAQF
jgi:hypothetical protein